MKSQTGAAPVSHHIDVRLIYWHEPDVLTMSWGCCTLCSTPGIHSLLSSLGKAAAAQSSTGKRVAGGKVLVLELQRHILTWGGQVTGHLPPSPQPT